MSRARNTTHVDTLTLQDSFHHRAVLMVAPPIQSVDNVIYMIYSAACPCCVKIKVTTHPRGVP